MEGKKTFYIAAGLVSLFSLMGAVNQYVIFRPEFIRETNFVKLEATEREVEHREEAICWYRESLKKEAYQLCMQEFARLRAIRLGEVLSVK
jgi:hypothetical protein